MFMAMEICRACSSAAAAATTTALLAASFTSLSALPRVSMLRRSTSAAHLALDQPGGLSFAARGFLVFGKPSSPIFFGGIVVEGKRRSYNCGEWRGEWGYAAQFGGKTK